MKIDCSITENYLKELKRSGRTLNVNQPGTAKQEVENMQEWSDANEQKTYLEDFKEKFPNFDGNDHEIIKNNSKYCVALLYGKAPKMKDSNGHQYSCNAHCQKCWNQITEENNA